MFLEIEVDIDERKIPLPPVSQPLPDRHRLPGRVKLFSRRLHDSERKNLSPVYSCTLTRLPINEVAVVNLTDDIGVSFTRLGINEFEVHFPEALAKARMHVVDRETSEDLEVREFLSGGRIGMRNGFANPEDEPTQHILTILPLRQPNSQQTRIVEVCF